MTSVFLPSFPLGLGRFSPTVFSTVCQNSSDESYCDESCPYLPSSDEEEEEVTRDNRKGEGTLEGLGDDEGGVSLEIEKAHF